MVCFNISNVITAIFLLVESGKISEFLEENLQS